MHNDLSTDTRDLLLFRAETDRIHTRLQEQGHLYHQPSSPSEPAVILQHRSVPPVQLTPRQQAVADKVREDFAKLEQEAKLRKLDAIEALDRLMDLHGDHLVDIWVTNLLWTRAQIRGEK
jgi:hypothetical protein